MKDEPDIAACLDKPVRDAKVWFTAPVRGWIVPPDRVRALRVYLDRKPIRDFLPGSEYRPDVARAFPGVPGAEKGGFYELVPLGGKEGVRKILVTALSTSGKEHIVGRTRVVNSKDVLRRPPRFFHLGFTTRCNLSCAMCPAHGTPRKEDGKARTISPGILSEALKGLEYYSDSIQRIFLADYGEPFLYPEIFDVIARIHRICPRASLFINTNGLLLDARMAERITFSDLHDIAFSLDAATKETHEAIRRGSDFNLLLGNIRRLVECRNAMKRTFPRIITNFVLMRSNIREFPEYVRLAASLGVDHIGAVHAFGVSEWDASQKIYDLDNPRAIMEFMGPIREGISVAEKAGVTLDLPPLFPSPPRIECRSRGGSVPHITPAGDVYPCPVLGALEYSGRGDVRPFGNLAAQSLREIWESGDYSRFRQAFFEGTVPHPVCNSCLKYYDM